jgi:hypothetical protein
MVRKYGGMRDTIQCSTNMELDMPVRLSKLQG